MKGKLVKMEDIKNKVRELVNKAESELKEQYKIVDEICEFNSEKVLTAFQKNRVTETDFGSTTGYGYDDIGREKIEKVFETKLTDEIYNDLEKMFNME